MRTRALGQSGLRVPVMGLGSWLTLGAALDEARSEACVKQALALGMTLFDTADAYAEGAAERMLGRALRGVRRSSVVLVSKVFFPTGDGPNDRGLSRKHLLESVDASRERLATPYLDLVLAHRFDPETPLRETVTAMSDLVTRGVAHYWGVSEWSAVQIVEALWLADRHGLRAPVVNQPMYNALQRRIEIDVLDTCSAHGLGVLAYSPLAQGVLSGKYRPSAALPAGSRAADAEAGALLRTRMSDDVLERVARLAPIAASLGLSTTQLSLAWCLREPAVSSVLLGASSPDQLVHAVHASDVALSPETCAAIDAVLGTAPIDQYTGRPPVRRRSP